jgi:hypothetical protein
MPPVKYFFIILVLVASVGCAGSDESGLARDYDKGKPGRLNGTEVQAGFEDAYLSLEMAISRGDIRLAGEEYGKLEYMYQRTNEIMGEEHLENFFTPEDMEHLERELEEGDLRAARFSLKKIGRSCGASSCHNRVGSSMAKLEVEYGIIKKAISTRDLEKAEEHMPAFSQYWHESKAATSTFMPEQVEAFMKDEYLEALNESVVERDLTGAEEALDTISSTACSLSGCHKVFFTDDSTWKFF